MSIIEGVVVGAETGGFYPKEIEQSLRFNDNDSAYLSWTPVSAGNRKTWTFSTWVKRGNLDTSWLFTSGPSYSDVFFFGFLGDNLFIRENHSSSSQMSLITTEVYRDVSSWYHIVLAFDSTQVTASDRVKLFVNGSQVSLSSTYPSQNLDSYVNSTSTTCLAKYLSNTTEYFDGYLAETHFIDGTAYDATAFGEFKNGVWIAKEFAGTYGTNGFYLPYRNDYTVEGFSATTYTGNGGTQYIGGVGFEPDLVWIKSRSFSNNHHLFDSVRGHSKILRSSSTDAESTLGVMTSFDSDGFTVAETGGNNATNDSGSTFVAWCWDAGTGSPVSNTDGSITSTVKANPDRGFSISNFTIPSSGNFTVGHGLSQAPDMFIVKRRATTSGWGVWHTGLSGGTYYTLLDSTGAQVNDSTVFSASPDSSVLNIGSAWTSGSGGTDAIAYCFHSVSGYSKMGSYTGTGATGNTVTTGFKPAFVMVKKTSATSSWNIYDDVRGTSSPTSHYLSANSSAAENSSYDIISFTDTGFVFNSGGDNDSGATYIYMAFADTREAAFWLDDSGNNNDWENNGLTESDISLDSPTNNFATLNPLNVTSSVLPTFSEGNLKASLGNFATWRSAVSTFKPSSGKWYAETLVTGTVYGLFGIGSDDFINKTHSIIGFTAGSWGWQMDGKVYNNSSVTQTISTYTAGDILGMAVDIDGGTVKWYKNGTLAGTNNITAGEEYLAGFSNIDSAYPWTINFGQDSSFAGNKTPQGYTDANGIGDFYYAPPAGYLALCTANLPEPAIGPNSATTADENFNTLAYSGTEGTDSKTGVGFQPDFTWIKGRSGAYGHCLYDAVRGATNQLSSNSTNAEATNPANGILTSFDSDGFSLSAGSSSDLNVNDGSNTYVAWNWKADNTSGSTNTDGTITSTVSANVDAGFSIVGYTGNGSSSATVGHGLSTAELMIFKDRNGTGASGGYWNTYYTPNDTQGWLNLTNAFGSNSGGTNGSINTSTVDSGYFGFINGSSSVNNWNNNGTPYIAYCFHSVEGYSKFGSYTGNGSTDGPFVYTGFRPAFVICKRTDAGGHWAMYDSSRGNYNTIDNQLLANDSAAEQDLPADIDFLSNGFKLRDFTNRFNTSGASVIYMAFAENPFKYSNAR